MVILTDYNLYWFTVNWLTANIIKNIKRIIFCMLHFRKESMRMY